jgi:hypothetical protein
VPLAEKLTGYAPTDASQEYVSWFSPVSSPPSTVSDVVVPIVTGEGLAITAVATVGGAFTTVVVKSLPPS